MVRPGMALLLLVRNPKSWNKTQWLGRDIKQTRNNGQGNSFVAAWKCRPEKTATTTTKRGKYKQRNVRILYCTSSLRPHATYVLSDRW